MIDLIQKLIDFFRQGRKAQIYKAALLEIKAVTNSPTAITEIERIIDGVVPTHPASPLK